MLLKTIFLSVLFAVLLEAPLAKYKADSVKWEKDIVAYEEKDKKEVAGKEDILFLGSSSIRLWKDIKQDMAPWTVVSRGYGGAKYSDLAIFTPRLIAAHHPKAIVIFVANDISGGKADKSSEEIVSLVDNITTTIHTRFPGLPIFYIAITPNSQRWKVWPEISNANEAIEKYCTQKPGLHFITTARSYLNEQGVPRDELFNSDFLHQNSDGYALWSSIIKRELEKVLTPKS